MRLTRKFTVAITIAILVVLSINAVVRVNREVALLEGDVQRDASLMGRAIAGGAARIWQRVGQVEAVDLVEDANERESAIVIRWVWLDDPAGSALAPTLALATLPPLGASPVSVRADAPVSGELSLFTYVPIVHPGARRAAIELRESLAAEQAYLRRTVVQAVIMTLALVVVCGGIALAVGLVFVGRPVRQLVAHARRIGEGDLSARLELRQRDEIGELGQEMNAMSARLAVARAHLDDEINAKLAAVEQLRHADRLATVGKLAAGVAHEVGTPLNAIIGYAQLITAEQPPGTSAHDHALVIAEQVRRVTAIIRQLLDFARRRSPRPALHDLQLLISQSVSLLEALARRGGVTLEVVACGPAIEVYVDAGQIQQVVTNLVVNAIHASPTGATVTVGWDQRTVAPPADLGRPEGDHVCVFIRDHGTGIAPEHVSQIFEPFFTTKDIGEGTGLGLSVAYGIVQEHGGWIAVDSALGKGSCLTIYLPAAEAS